MARILVTGSDGLVGSALRRAAKGSQHEFVFSHRSPTAGLEREARLHTYCDLDRTDQVARFFDFVKPDAVIHTAAFVGGIGQQEAHPFDLAHQNLLMNCNVIEQCVRHKVKRLLAFSSVCAMPDYSVSYVHPKDVGKDFKELSLNEGDMHAYQPPKENWHYGYAKRMVDVLIDGAMRQHGAKNWCSVIPVNIYGPNDNYRLGVCHVVPALIHKLYLARKNGEPLKVWGDGSAVREFLYADDLAKVLLRLLDLPEVPQRLIVSPSVPCSVQHLVTELCVAAGHRDGFIDWQRDKPNGQHARPTDTSLLRRLLPGIEWTPLRDGLRASYEWFATNYPQVRM